MALAAIVDFVYGSVVVAFQWLALAIARLMDLAGLGIPAWLEEFISYKPQGQVLTQAAILVDKMGLNPEVVEDSPIKSIGTGLKNQITEGMVGAAEAIGKSVADEMETVLENQAVIIPTTQG